MSHSRKRRSARPSFPPDWAVVFRDGISPLLTDSQLHALLRGLLADDPELLQGKTTDPTAGPADERSAPCGACVLGYALWKGQVGNPSGQGFTVGDIEDAFANLVASADAALGAVGACRAFFAYVDDEPRHAMRFGLMAEVCKVLAARKGGGAA